MQRPGGVIAIAILYWLSAFTLLLVGIIMAVGFTAFGSVAQGMMGLFAGFGVIGGIVLLGLGAVLAFLGYSVFQLQEWARITTIVLVALGFGAAVLSFFNFGGGARISSLFRMAIDAVIIWYLVQPQVSAAFRRSTS